MRISKSLHSWLKDEYSARNLFIYLMFDSSTQIWEYHVTLNAESECNISLQSFLPVRCLLLPKTNAVLSQCWTVTAPSCAEILIGYYNDLLFYFNHPLKIFRCLLSIVIKQHVEKLATKLSVVYRGFEVNSIVYLWNSANCRLFKPGARRKDRKKHPVFSLISQTYRADPF